MVYFTVFYLGAGERLLRITGRILSRNSEGVTTLKGYSPFFLGLTKSFLSPVEEEDIVWKDSAISKGGISRIGKAEMV